MGMNGLTAAGTAALDAGRWADARATFTAALQDGESAEVLYGLGEALWWLGETHASIDYHQRAYAAFRRAGNAHRAAWTALWLGLTYGADLGNGAAYNGWVVKAERVLQEVESSPIQGWLWLIRAYGVAELSPSRDLAERALTFARDTGDVDLELCALGHLGEVLVAAGEIEAGLSLVDEAMAGTFGGERRRLDTAVFTSCSMLNACELAADLVRATQWCQVADAFIETYGCPFLHARCRTAYGRILLATGDWANAERELTAVLRTSRAAYPAMYALALAHLAELRLRQGRLEEADELLVGTDQACAALVTAQLLLARGEAEAAVALLQQRLASLPAGHLDAGATAALLVEAHLANGDVDAAAASAERLLRLARKHNRDHLTAYAALAAARVSLAKVDHGSAKCHWADAIEHFSRLGLPLETARARLELARTVAPTQPSTAILEARRAFAALDRLGAAADANAASAFLRSLGAASPVGAKRPGALTKREREVLQLVGLGLTNPEIAQRMVISRKTAAHHVSSVLAKLGLRNRAEAVAYATRTGGNLLPS